MRDECQQEEAKVSYARRVLQGKLDIVRAEVARRQDGGAESDVLDHLSEILADHGVRPAGAARATRFLVPPEDSNRRRSEDNVADDDALAALHERDAEELSALVETLTARERSTSTARRLLLDRIDALQDELTSRYKSEGLDVSDILARRM